MDLELGTVIGEATPLYELLKKNAPWNWSDEVQESFERVKFLLSSAPILAHYDPKLPLRLYCDVSLVGVGLC